MCQTEIDLAADSLAQLVVHRVHPPGNLMTWNSRIFYPGPDAIFDQQITVANPARFHFDANLSRLRLGQLAFEQFKIPSGLSNLCRFHFHAKKVYRCVRFNKV